MSRSEPLRLLPPAGAAFAPARRTTSVTPAEIQVMARDGARRGLREGEPALKRARTAYLSAEWSGGDDRRPEVGLLVHGRL